MKGYTPGPWHLIDDDGTDFTAIATVPTIQGSMDLDHEVLGSSGWLRVKLEDLILMASAPDLLAELENIANANPRLWDVEVRDQFQQWAQSRARAAIAKATGSKA